MGRTNRDMKMVSFFMTRADKLALDSLAAVWGVSQGEAYRRCVGLGLLALKADPDRFGVPSAVHSNSTEDVTGGLEEASDSVMGD